MSAVPTMTPLLTELTRRGVEVVAVDGRIELRPDLPDGCDLWGGIEHHKPRLLALMQRCGSGSEPSLTTDTLTPPRRRGDSNPLPPAPADRGELLLDRLTPDARQVVERVVSEFADLGDGIEVIEVTTVWGREAAALLATVEDDRLRVLFRDLFEERAGICQFHGGLSLVEAERVAFEELQQAIRAGPGD